MLRNLSLAAPVVAAILVVVLLVEPPALRPAERMPTLRMLTARPEAGLDRTQLEAAVARGREGAPESYVLDRVPSAGDVIPSSEPAGVVYTPFLRVAWAAHAREAAGQPLSVDEVPSWLASSVVYLALRRPSVAATDVLGTPAVVAIRPDTATCCLDPQPTVIRPLWITDNPEVIARFGAEVPFSDLGVIAVFPIEVLRGGLDVVAYHRVDGPDGPSSVEMRGRFDPDDIEQWR